MDLNDLSSTPDIIETLETVAGMCLQGAIALDPTIIKNKREMKNAMNTFSTAQRSIFSFLVLSIHALKCIENGQPVPYIPTRAELNKELENMKKTVQALDDAPTVRRSIIEALNNISY
ncbi:MAG: hypothetical protein Q4A55_00515 [Aerococcus sp.]|nr:hypothetical protein [Aerococcus sp.]